MPNFKVLMESNGDRAYLGGWGMSISTQRAKERENRTPDVEVMAETVKHSRLSWGGRAHGGRSPWARGPVRTVHVLRARGHLGNAGLADFFLIWAPNGWISLLGFSWGYGGGMGGWEIEGAAAEVHWKGRAHGVCLARVHGVLCERMNCSRSVGWGQNLRMEGRGRWRKARST